PGSPGPQSALLVDEQIGLRATLPTARSVGLDHLRRDLKRAMDDGLVGRSAQVDVEIDRLGWKPVHGGESSLAAGQGSGGGAYRRRRSRGNGGRDGLARPTRRHELEFWCFTYAIPADGDSRGCDPRPDGWIDVECDSARHAPFGARAPD